MIKYFPRYFLSRILPLQSGTILAVIVSFETETEFHFRSSLLQPRVPLRYHQLPALSPIAFVWTCISADGQPFTLLTLHLLLLLSLVLLSILAPGLSLLAHFAA